MTPAATSFCRRMDSRQARPMLARFLNRCRRPCPGATKLLIGIFDQFGKLVGLIDVLRGYRKRTDWYVGLMLLAPAFQGQGFGTEIHDEFVSYARREGIHRLLLAVLEANESARRFWLRLGYRKVKDFPPRQFGKSLHGLTEFEQIL